MLLSNLPEGTRIIGMEDDSSKQGILRVQLSGNARPEVLNDSTADVVGGLCREFETAGARVVRFVSPDGQQVGPLFAEGTKYPWKKNGTVISRGDDK
mgnify:CR=1 FL=1|jgi:hypothetical protein